MTKADALACAKTLDLAMGAKTQIFKAQDAAGKMGESDLKTRVGHRLVTVRMELEALDREISFALEEHSRKDGGT